MDDIFSGLDDSPNSGMPKPEIKHIRIEPISPSPFNMFELPPFMRPMGPVTHHASLGDFLSNISKPGPHPKFDTKKSSTEITDLTEKKTDLSSKD